MKTRKDLSMSLYLIYACRVIFSVCGLMLLLSSCESDIDKILSGENITVNFSITPVNYGAHENITCSNTATIRDILSIYLSILLFI